MQRNGVSHHTSSTSIREDDPEKRNSDVHIKSNPVLEELEAMLLLEGEHPFSVPDTETPLAPHPTKMTRKLVT